ncbi:MAG: hypothetical protein LH614_08155 [Pyrinomonadaceae bacterium]|nr:hypothetical protein [Pyrinomonadaceae bacterium]
MNSIKIALLFVIGSILFSNFTVAEAQICSETMLAAKSGVWKASPLKDSTTNVSPADLTREKSVLANVHKTVAANYTPTGLEALYSNSFGGANPSSGKNWAADYYVYSVYLFAFLCDPASADKSKSYTAVATATTLNIHVNWIPQLDTLYAAELADDDLRGYLKMKRMPQKKNGFYYFGEDFQGDPRDNIKVQTWLITHDDQLPFKYVSRREYLLLTKKRLEKTISEDSTGKGFYDQYLNRINSSLNESEAELSKPAICRWNDEERFAGFVEEDTKGSFIAVKPNPAYYRKNLQKSVPQFFTVAFKVAGSQKIYTNNMESLQKAFDFNALRNMLGK